MKGNALYALIGIVMAVVGIPVLLMGILAMLGLLVATLFGGLVSGSMVTFIQALGIFAVISGAVMSWLGLYLVNKHGGKLFRVVVGIIAIMSAIASAILAVLLVETVIGLFVFLMAMVFFLIVADWGMNTEFFTKFIKAVPVIGNAVVGVVKFTLPRKR